MYFVLLYILVCLLVGSFFLLICLVPFKTMKDMEKGSPFECGFEPSGFTRLPFCMKFFLVAVIFLVFDIEIALILPMFFSSLIIISFILIITLGVFFEWLWGGLDWIV